MKASTCRFTFRAASFVLVAAFGLSLTSDALGQGKDKDFQRSSPAVIAAFREVVTKSSKSTVRIKCDGKEAALGTVVHADGFILTKFSELKGTIICRLKDGREMEAKVVGVHEQHDVAMLKIDVKELTVVEWIESKNAPVGHWVASPSPGEDPVAIGVVSVLSRNLPAVKGPTPNPNSGYLGIALDPAATGAKISEVLKGGGAEKAGIKVNDVVLAINGKDIENLDAFMATVQKHKPGEVLTLKIKRGDEEMEIKATLGKRPPVRADYQNSLGSELSNRRTGFPNVLQHDQVIKPTDCGGPVVDLDGKVIGVNIARGGRTESYAIPSETLLPLIPELMSGKLAPKPDLTALKSDLEKKLAEARDVIQKAEAEKLALEKKIADAKALLEKLEAELKGIKEKK
ncbi:MAG: PDZ domain-containing protein [Gemmataceae bacterium]|nr:PDZ domain-containing protein [Gemmataceae bacterium]